MRIGNLRLLYIILATLGAIDIANAVECVSPEFSQTRSVIDGKKFRCLYEKSIDETARYLQQTPNVSVFEAKPEISLNIANLKKEKPAGRRRFPSVRKKEPPIVYVVYNPLYRRGSMDTNQIKSLLGEKIVVTTRDHEGWSLKRNSFANSRKFYEAVDKTCSEKGLPWPEYLPEYKGTIEDPPECKWTLHGRETVIKKECLVTGLISEPFEKLNEVEWNLVRLDDTKHIADVMVESIHHLHETFHMSMGIGLHPENVFVDTENKKIKFTQFDTSYPLDVDKETIKALTDYFQEDTNLQEVIMSLVDERFRHEVVDGIVKTGGMYPKLPELYGGYLRKDSDPCYRSINPKLQVVDDAWADYIPVYSWFINYLVTSGANIVK